MTKTSLLNKVFAGLTLALLPAVGFASSYEIHNTTEMIGGTWTSGTTDILVGPTAQITVNGDWYITASNVYIHPSATITGTGTIHLMTPATAPFFAPAAATNLDAGSVTIGCKLSIENGNTVTLNQITPGTAYPTSGITDAGAGTNNLVMANSLNFNSTSAHLFINGNNVIFTSAAAATITYADLNTAGFTPDPNPPANPYMAYIVTSGASTGYVMKQGLASASSFTFPVGQSGPATAPYDYTPVMVTNTSGAARNFGVRVYTYANSPTVEYNTTKGMNRTWQVFSDVAATATIALTHNAANNPAGNGTNGAAYDNNRAYITQFGPSGWSTGGAPYQAGGTPVNTLSRSVTVGTIASTTSYFSKTSDSTTSLNPRLMISPIAILQGSYNGDPSTINMNTTLRDRNVIPLSQPYGPIFGYTGTEAVAAIPANVTDWVLVELRDAATPSTVIATRAAFIRSNDTVVDLDGVSPVTFNSAVIPAGPYYVTVRHRNHLGIRSSVPVVLVSEITSYYNFTTSQAQAYQKPLLTNTAMTQVDPGRFAMWGGNADPNIFVSYQGADNDRVAILGGIGGNQSTVLQPVYMLEDVNMDGSASYQGVDNDRVSVLGYIGGVQATVIQEHL
jgi:hypothetical protein